MAARPATAGRLPDTDAWDRVLAAHEHEGGVDYGALKQDPEDLETYLTSFASVEPESWSDAETIAAWSNIYNAVVVHRVIQDYPGFPGVNEVDGFFDGRTFPVGGEELTLDQMEDRAREVGDARVHFTVVCASTSCPDLRHEAYRASKLEQQLREQTREFLSDPQKGLRYDAEENTLWLSSIFKWYAGDFTGGSTIVAFFARGGVLEWVIDHAPEDLASTLEKRDPSIRYLDYDWSLNDRPR